jgi:CheY-like chemotaxis protein
VPRKKSILNGKRILAVDDEIDVLECLQEELEDFGAIADAAMTHDEAERKILSKTYDAAILDIMGVRGFELLSLAAERGLPAVMLTAHAISLEALEKSAVLGARAYIPKDQLCGIVPFLEDLLNTTNESMPAMKSDELKGYMGISFPSEWRKSEGRFPRNIAEKILLCESVTLRK